MNTFFDSDNQALRIVELEIHVAQLEATTTELSDVINSQWQMIDKLNKDVNNLKNFLREAASSNNDAVGQEPPPPHY